MFFMNKSNNKSCFWSWQKRILIKKLFVTEKNTYLNLFKLSSLTNNLSIASNVYVKISSLLNSFSSFTMDVLPSEDWSELLCSVPLRGRAERRIGQVLTLNCPEQAAWCRALSRPTQHITNTRSERDTREKYPAFLFSTLIVRIIVESSLKLSLW